MFSSIHISIYNFSTYEFKQKKKKKYKGYFETNLKLPRIKLDNSKFEAIVETNLIVYEHDISGILTVPLIK